MEKDVSRQYQHVTIETGMLQCSFVGNLCYQHVTLRAGMLVLQKTSAISMSV